MILKKKKDCKLIYNNLNFYIQANGRLINFGNNLERAEEYYYNCKNYEKYGEARVMGDKIGLELYP